MPPEAIALAYRLDLASGERAEGGACRQEHGDHSVGRDAEQPYKVSPSTFGDSNYLVGAAGAQAHHGREQDALAQFMLLRKQQEGKVMESHHGFAQTHSW